MYVMVLYVACFCHFPVFFAHIARVNEQTRGELHQQPTPELRYFFILIKAPDASGILKYTRAVKRLK